MRESIKLWDRTFEPMIPANEIECAVERVAEQINRDYCDDDRLLLLGVLNGSFIFLADLARRLNFKVELCFVKLASYSGCESSGEVRDLIGLDCPLDGRNVLIVEDIVDSGRSIKHICNMLDQQGVASKKICTLFFKPEAYRESLEIDYRALEIGNEFIVGYGLDYDGLGRELADIYVTK